MSEVVKEELVDKEKDELEQGLRNLIQIGNEVGYQVVCLGMELQKLSRGYGTELDRIKKRASSKKT